MTQLESEKKMDDSSYDMTIRQPRLPKIPGLNSFPKTLAVVGLLFSAAYAKPTNPPTNPCNVKTQFWVEDTDGSTSCEDCPPCPLGQTLSIECGKRILSTDWLNCVSCPAGVSFSEKDDTSGCTPCSTCAEDQVVVRNCTPEWDIKCEMRCYSKDRPRYYDEDKGDCLPCSRCCYDGQDVVEDECKERLGAGSNMICSLDSSFNRCYIKSTPSPQKPNATPNRNTTISDSTNSVRGSEQGHSSTAEPPSSNWYQTPTTNCNDPDLLTVIGIPFAVLATLLVVLYLAWKACTRKKCRSKIKKTTDENLDALSEAEKVIVNGESHRRDVLSTESLQPLLQEGNPDGLGCSCQQDVEKKSDTDGTSDEMSKESTLQSLLGEGIQEDLEGSYQQESSLLKNLLNCENDLQEISVRLDTPMVGAGNYRVVAQHYGFDHYQISSVLEKHERGPSAALIEALAAKKPGLTVRDFASIVLVKAERKDVVEVLLAYDANHK